MAEKKNEKYPASEDAGYNDLNNESALAELGRPAGSLQTVLLAFLHTRIAGQQAGFLQGAAHFGISLAQGTADAVTDRAGLAGQTAAADVDHDVKITDIGQVHGLANRHLQGFKSEIIVDIALVDHDFAIAGNQADAGNGFFATANSTVFSLSHT